MRALHLAFYASLFCCSTITGSTRAANSAGEWSACHPRLETHMEIIATDAAIDCGFFSPGASPERFEEIKFCARNVVDTDRPFKFGYAEYGDDSLFCQIAARDSSGQLRSYFYDTDITGGRGGPSALDISKCETLTFAPATFGKYGFFYLDNCEPDETLNAILRR